MDSNSHHRLWQRAAAFAARRHAGQLRKDSQTPYFAHPARVALTLSHVFGVNDAVVLAAALLHDLIEDTHTDYDDLFEEFGPEVADIVAALTKDKRLPEAEREESYFRALATAPWRARLIKLADVYDNYCDSWEERLRARMATRARQAIEAAGDEPLLRTAIARLEELLRSSPHPLGE
jgi:guanosine-3',5'-bis(diphosphate) 3'-pyrophosphohydrolase